MRKFVLLLLIIFQVEAAEKTQKYNLSVCAIFRNEAPYLKEWIEYHLLIGVDHFYLYNNGSIDSFKKVLNPYIKNDQVTLVQWISYFGPTSSEEFIWPLSAQISAYENAIKWSAAGKTKWLVFLDIDEFLVPCSKEKITDILESYDDYPGITLTSEHFDASTRGTLPQRKLVIEATEITNEPEMRIERAVEKTILKPDLCTFFLWPPYKCLFKGEVEAKIIKREELRINHYENRMRFQRVDKVKTKIHLDKKIPEEEKKELLTQGYEIEDPEKAIYRYVPDLCKKLNLTIPK